MNAAWGLSIKTVLLRRRGSSYPIMGKTNTYSDGPATRAAGIPLKLPAQVNVFNFCGTEIIYNSILPVRALVAKCLISLCCTLSRLRRHRQKSSSCAGSSCSRRCCHPTGGWSGSHRQEFAWQSCRAICSSLALRPSCDIYRETYRKS